MNTNALILLGVLLGLLVGFILGMKALRSQTSTRKKVYAGITLLVLSSSLIGGISVGWRMLQTQPYTAQPAPLDLQSQVIIHQWDQHDLAPHVYRSSLSGRDGTTHWGYSNKSKCTGTLIFTQANGVIYEQGAIPEKQEICVQASRLNDGSELWYQTIRSSQPPENLRAPTSAHLLAVQGKLYLQDANILYELDAANGKILSTIKPEIAGSDADLIDFAANNDVLVLEYSVLSNVNDDNIGPTQSVFVVLQASNGKMLWKSERTYQDLLALQGDTLYTHTQGRAWGIVALRAHDGSQQWQSHLPKLRIFASSASAGHVYLRAENFVGPSDTFVYTLDAQNGQVLWKVPVASWGGGSPVEANNITYIADTNKLSAYKATTGQLLWRYEENPLPSTAIAFNPYDVIYFNQPVIVGDVVFVTNNFMPSLPPPFRLIPNFCLGRYTPITGVFALRASDGKLYWRHQTESYTELLAASSA